MLGGVFVAEPLVGKIQPSIDVDIGGVYAAGLEFIDDLPGQPPFAAGLRHTAQEHLFEVVVQYPHHPRAGERVMVLRRVLHGARVHFVIEQPDGCRVLLPAWMTETSAAAMPMVEVPRLSLDALRELRGLIDAQRVSSSPSSETTPTGGGDDGTTCTMATTRSPGARDKRNPTPATRSDDSLGGRRSAQASSQRMQRRPRKGERGGR